MMIKIITKCPMCQKEHEVLVHESDWNNYKQQNMLVHDAFPYLSAEDREMLVTGICPDCWNKLFPPEEEIDEIEN